jgi:hypothetical protein
MLIRRLNSPRSSGNDCKE